MPLSHLFRFFLYLGKIFEGNPEVMLESLQAIKELPSDTLIFPGK